MTPVGDDDSAVGKQRRELKRIELKEVDVLLE